MDSMFKVRKTEPVLEDALKEIERRIRSRQELGVYEHFDMSRVTYYQLKNIKDPDEYLRCHLECIKRSWAIDVNDFEIPLRSKGVVRIVEKTVKTVIWKLLKFYTFRLFSQQREYNLLLTNTLISFHQTYNETFRKLQLDLKMIKERKRT